MAGNQLSVHSVHSRYSLNVQTGEMIYWQPRIPRRFSIAGERDSNGRKFIFVQIHENYF